MPDGSSVQFTQSLKDDLQSMEAAHPGLDAKIASGGGRMNVTMDRYEVGGMWLAGRQRGAAGGSLELVDIMPEGPWWQRIIAVANPHMI